MTPAQILSTIRNQIYETTAGFWSDDELRAYEWQGECEIASITECTEATDSSTTTVASTATYAIPSDCLYIKELTWDSYPLKCVDIRGFDALEMPSYGNTLTEGKPTHYVLKGSDVGLWPVPDSAETLMFYYIAEPAEITSSSTAFTIPQLFHHLLPDYVLYRCYAKDQDEGRANFHKRAWMEGIQRAQMLWAKRKYGGRFPVVKDSSYNLSAVDGLV